MKNAFSFAGIALAAALVSTSASADEVNFSGSSVNMGTVAVGQYGTISNIYQTLFTLPPNVIGSGDAYGFLPKNAKITFTYNIAGLIDGKVQGYGSYNYNQAGNSYMGSAIADSTGYSYHEGSINGGASTPLVTAAANLTYGNPSIGTVVVTNTSDSLAQFQSLFFGILNGASLSSGFINYVVSAVPLPAALPMFGAMLASVFGVARFRRKRVAA